MLILSRGAGEKIVIDGTIIVEVIEIRRGVVRIGVEAPKHIEVNRAEIEEAKKRYPRMLD